MKYFERTENVTNEYEVVINEEELTNIIKELNDKCSRAVKVSVNIRADEDRALESFNTLGKNGIDIVKKVADGNEDKDKKYFYECEYFRKQIPYIAYLLSATLNSYRSNVDMTNVLNQLIECQNSDELKTYQERMAEHGITPDLYYEYENNKDFDFNLLRELYHKAMNCFKLNLISKTIYYDSEENTKKLGGK